MNLPESSSKSSMPLTDYCAELSFYRETLLILHRFYCCLLEVSTNKLRTLSICQRTDLLKLVQELPADQIDSIYYLQMQEEQEAQQFVQLALAAGVAFLVQTQKALSVAFRESYFVFEVQLVFAVEAVRLLHYRLLKRLAIWS